MKLAKISESVDRHMPDTCQSFEFGQCSTEVLRVVQRALSTGFNKFIVVDGMVGVNGQSIPHTWIEVNGEIKDPTASQFDGDIEYSPEGEYRDEHRPEDFVNNFEDQYGVPPSDFT
jgi:hypothetical protein